MDSSALRRQSRRMRNGDGDLAFQGKCVHRESDLQLIPRNPSQQRVSFCTEGIPRVATDAPDPHASGGCWHHEPSCEPALTWSWMQHSMNLTQHPLSGVWHASTAELSAKPKMEVVAGGCRRNHSPVQNFVLSANAMVCYLVSFTASSSGAQTYATAAPRNHQGMTKIWGAAKFFWCVLNRLTSLFMKF